MRTILFPLLILVAALVVWWVFGSGGDYDVVLYCGVDQDQSRPIAERFAQQEGIKVDFVPEVEIHRSIGHHRKLMKEKDNPRADVFWANEIMNMADLGNHGVLASLPEGVAEKFPPMWRDPQGHYVAFGARARVLLVNTELLPNEDDHPRSIWDLLNPRYAEMGFVTCMAKPVTGTTYTHAVALLTWDEERGKRFLEEVAAAGREGRMKIAPSNGSAMSLVKDSSQNVAFCLTDTDDAYVAIREGAPVTVIYPDQGNDEDGTVLIPNTVALVKGGPNLEAGAKLLEWLISPDNELRLAKGPSAQIPLRPELARAQLPAHVKRPGTDFRAAEVDWQAVGENRDRWLDYLSSTFNAP